MSTSITSSTKAAGGERADTRPAGIRTLPKRPLTHETSFTSLPSPEPEARTQPRPPLAGADVVGLDIQPGFVAAVQRPRQRLDRRRACRQRAARRGHDARRRSASTRRPSPRRCVSCSPRHSLGKRVRVGVANQRTVLRTLELPPVTDHKELAAAVSFQAQDQVPMPLGNAVLDFHPLGIIDTPAGPRQRVVLVAAQRDMVERLLSAVRQRRPDRRGRRPLRLRADPLPLPPRSRADRARALPERRRPLEPGDRRGHGLPLHPRRRQRPRGHGRRARRAPRHRARRRPRAAARSRPDRAARCPSPVRSSRRAEPRARRRRRGRVDIPEPEPVDLAAEAPGPSAPRSTRPASSR